MMKVFLTKTTFLWRQQFYKKFNSIYYYFHKPEIKLGRWSIIYHPKKIEERVKRENEDHSF